MGLSAVVIAKNEEPRIGTCLDSLGFADEIVVIDNGSTDNTAGIARTRGAKVVTAEGRDFSAMRDMGCAESKGDWILYVDADETVPPSLAEEIRKTTAATPGPCGAYYIRRDNRYLGVPWPKGDRMQRLFYRKSLKGWHGTLHETADVEGETRELINALVHDTHRTLSEMTAKTNEWSELEARLRLDAGHPPVVWWRLLRVMWTGFSRSFFGEAGYRAGTAGWIEAVFQSFSMFITYAKLWEMQEKDK